METGRHRAGEVIQLANKSAALRVLYKKSLFICTASKKWIMLVRQDKNWGVALKPAL
jgi:hypothetical protein